jgi:hypothetical protein
MLIIDGPVAGRLSLEGIMQHASLFLAGAAWLSLGCSDGGIGPRPEDEGQRLAGQFERLADSMGSGADSGTAGALRHAAEIVRLTGHATPVTLTIDGRSRNFLAVAEQLDYPNLVCSWPPDTAVPPTPGDTIPGPPLPPPDTTREPPPPPPDTTIVPPADSLIVALADTVNELPPECRVEGTRSMRSLIAWEPEHLAEVTRIVAYIGSGEVEPDVPDVMTGLPGGARSSTPPDSGSGSGGEPGGFPGFMGEYLVRDEGRWWAVEGSQRNDLETSGGACTHDSAAFDWAEFSCEAARVGFEFTMGVESPGRSEERHTLAMASSSVDGVRLTWVSWRAPEP